MTWDPMETKDVEMRDNTILAGQFGSPMYPAPPVTMTRCRIVQYDMAGFEEKRPTLRVSEGVDMVEPMLVARNMKRRG